ncbi:MAG: hypothetical protein MH204_11195 [Fimbriimonadaceae bacterium]|nr:hypothetical protein [Fimbriimonadaceae bacterium]
MWSLLAAAALAGTEPDAAIWATTLDQEGRPSTHLAVRIDRRIRLMSRGGEAWVVSGTTPRRFSWDAVGWRWDEAAVQPWPALPPTWASQGFAWRPAWLTEDTVTLEAAPRFPGPTEAPLERRRVTLAPSGETPPTTARSLPSRLPQRLDRPGAVTRWGWVSDGGRLNLLRLILEPDGTTLHADAASDPDPRQGEVRRVSPGRIKATDGRGWDRLDLGLLIGEGIQATRFSGGSFGRSLAVRFGGAQRLVWVAAAEGEEARTWAAAFPGQAPPVSSPPE